MRKKSYILLILTSIVFNVYSQNNTAKAKILKATITTVGSSSVSISNNKYFIAQSIGQSGIVGQVNLNATSIQQGFLNNVISFKVNNAVDKPINEILDFVIYPNPFVENIKINFAKKTSQDIYIRIYDINGKTFNYKKYLPTDKILIPLNRLSIGNYLIQIKTGNTKVTKKIIKVER